jgi:hypothetical protein
LRLRRGEHAAHERAAQIRDGRIRQLRQRADGDPLGLRVTFGANTKAKRPQRPLRTGSQRTRCLRLGLLLGNDDILSRIVEVPDKVTSALLRLSAFRNDIFGLRVFVVIIVLRNFLRSTRQDCWLVERRLTASAYAGESIFIRVYAHQLLILCHE